MPEPMDSPPPPSKSANKLYHSPKPEAITGWARFLPLRIERSSHGNRIRVAWKAAIVSLLLLAVLSWLTLASAAYFFVKYRQNFPEVSFTHMLLYPIRREIYRQERGEHLITEGKKQLEKQDYRKALDNLMAGLSLSPGNRDARLIEAQFFMAWQRPDRAEKLLIEGVPFHSRDKEYLQTVFSFLLQRQADAEVIGITGDLLAKADPSPVMDARLRIIAMARATALFYRGNYDAAEDILRKNGLLSSSDGQLLSLRIDWDRGEHEAAIDKLAALSEQMPENEQIYIQYATYLREAGRTAELRRLALIREIAYPDQHRPRIDLLYLYDKAGDEVSLRRGTEELFSDFKNNEPALLALADFSANTGRPELAHRIYAHCKANKLSWEGPALMTVEAYVVAKQYRQALDASQQINKENPEWGKRFSSAFNGLQAIANYGLKDEEAASLFLNNFLNHSGVRAENLVAVSNRLVNVGANREARQVLAQAVKTDPLNQPALAGLIKLDLERGNTDSVSTLLRTLMTMRKPPRELLQSAYTTLGSDRFLFAPGRAALLDELRKTILARPDKHG